VLYFVAQRALHFFRKNEAKNLANCQAMLCMVPCAAHKKTRAAQLGFATNSTAHDRLLAALLGLAEGDRAGARPNLSFQRLTLESTLARRDARQHATIDTRSDLVRQPSVQQLSPSNHPQHLIAISL
jgi:hypothetical protein